MQTNNHKTKSFSDVLKAKYGEQGTPEREEFNKEAFQFYSSQILVQTRKQAHVTQVELAKRLGVNKSYISKIEKGVTIPSVEVFFKVINALGAAIEIKKPHFREV